MAFGDLACFDHPSPTHGPLHNSFAYVPTAYLESRANGEAALAHELGHNLGMGHANALEAGAAVVGPVGVPGQSLEYKDFYDRMGSDTGLYNAQHLDALGWFDGEHSEQSVDVDGDYRIQPLESQTPVVKALRMARGAGSNFWIEYRQPLGAYDSTFPAAEPANSQVYGGALVHLSDPSLAADHSHLLDFSPGSRPNKVTCAVGAMPCDVNDVALLPGVRWQDPSSAVSLEVLSADAAGLTVRVHVASPNSGTPVQVDGGDAGSGRCWLSTGCRGTRTSAAATPGPGRRSSCHLHEF